LFLYLSGNLNHSGLLPILGFICDYLYGATVGPTNIGAITEVDWIAGFGFSKFIGSYQYSKSSPGSMSLKAIPTRVYEYDHVLLMNYKNDNAKANAYSRSDLYTNKLVYLQHKFAPIGQRRQEFWPGKI
jgi:hypothetical protein